jgi:cation-dependent mannose-6-phosphate receptor
VWRRHGRRHARSSIAAHPSVIIAILTWFGGHTLYNRFYLKKSGMDVFPIPKCHRPPGVRLPQPISSSDGSAQPRRSWSAPWKRRSQRAGYNHLRQDPNEEDHLAARFSIDDEDEDEDARVLGGVGMRRLRGHRRRRRTVRLWVCTRALCVCEGV